jgi:hypothetical protein
MSPHSYKSSNNYTALCIIHKLLNQKIQIEFDELNEARKISKID